MNDNIIIEKIWEEDGLFDCFFELRVTSENKFIRASSEIYTDRSGIMELCEGIRKFTDGEINEFHWQSGEFGDDSSECFSLKMANEDELGHVLIEVRGEIGDGGGYSAHNYCFYVRTKIGVLGEMGKRLRKFGDIGNIGIRTGIYEENDEFR